MSSKSIPIGLFLALLSLSAVISADEIVNQLINNVENDIKTTNAPVIRNVETIMVSKAPNHVGNGPAVVKTEVKVDIKKTTKHPILAGSGTTAAPKVTVVVKSEDHGNEPTHRFCDYLKPICDSIEKIDNKLMSSIQSQFKSFIGKVSYIF